MSVQAFGQWLYTTPAAAAIRETVWVIPTVQAIHILSIAVLVGSALVSNLRLAGVFAADEAPTTIIRRYLPWMWCALAVLLLTGLLLIVAEPGRTLNNAVFWTKMALVLFAFVLTLVFQKPLLNRQSADNGPDRSTMTKSAAWLSLGLWLAVIFCGRFIAYT
ncbi:MULTISPECIES: DUF6644 family protein [Nitrospirillum]|uniref:DUF6644 domain-containing protein n=3 Tax=Nitrospirillum TaxID=1543705 RepID=A0A248JUM8_9PROT|nr:MULTISPECIES: DUF6644 family protein [Nitrospirillum]ASG22309.1 hypothetical protein Y958_15235 [Nitrospirillum amazonense CBAmc]MEA1674594.1 DUF6644 family protein [Nitrospirillum sp. BR 11163]TWB43164.1 putative membrane protein DUF2214 [Nitrospirillum amazonense]TWB64367.1 putative membrane protein DUF2214 [Nitrospirillum amazonense]